MRQTKEIRNIYCVGRNYRDHAKELRNDVPKEPLIFTKPTHAVTWMNGQTIQLPRMLGDLHYEAELVIAIGDAYTEGKKAEELISGFTLGLDLTLRDVQSQLKEKGLPWLPAKGFRHSALLCEFQSFQSVEALIQEHFILKMDTVLKQKGCIADMIFDLDRIVEYCGQHYGLGCGDIIYTGTPEGVGSIQDKAKLSLQWGTTELGTISINR